MVPKTPKKILDSTEYSNSNVLVYSRPRVYWKQKNGAVLKQQ